MLQNVKSMCERLVKTRTEDSDKLVCYDPRESNRIAPTLELSIADWVASGNGHPP